MRRTTLRLGWLAAALVWSHNAVAAECDERDLPVTAQRLLSEKFGRWRVVRPLDLSSEDQRIWSEKYAGKCPGIVEGKFTGLQGREFAVTLIRRDGSRLLQNLLLLKPSDRSYTAKTLEGASEAAVPSVILRLPPGTYKDAAGRRSVRVKFDAIALVKLEAAGVLYYKRPTGFVRFDFLD